MFYANQTEEQGDGGKRAAKEVVGFAFICAVVPGEHLGVDRGGRAVLEQRGGGHQHIECAKVIDEVGGVDDHEG